MKSVSIFKISSKACLCGVSFRGPNLELQVSKKGEVVYMVTDL